MWTFPTTNSWVGNGQMCALHAFWCTCLSLPHCPSQGTQKISGLCTIFSATARAWSVQAVNGREGLRLPHAFLP